MTVTCGAVSSSGPALQGSAVISVVSDSTIPRPPDTGRTADVAGGSSSPVVPLVLFGSILLLASGGFGLAARLRGKRA